MKAGPTVCLAILVSAGCGARSYITAEHAEYPVSMTRAVRGPTGQILMTSNLREVGTLDIDYKACRMLWTLIPLWHGTNDISDEINAQIKEHKGEAILNLTVESSATIWSVMNLVGVLPDCSNVHVSGDIMARVAAAPSAPPAVTPPAVTPPAVTPPAVTPPAVTPPAAGAPTTLAPTTLAPTAAAP